MQPDFVTSSVSADPPIPQSNSSCLKSKLDHKLFDLNSPSAIANPLQRDQLRRVFNIRKTRFFRVQLPRHFFVQRMLPLQHQFRMVANALQVPQRLRDTRHVVFDDFILSSRKKPRLLTWNIPNELHVCDLIALIVFFWISDFEKSSYNFC